MGCGSSRPSQIAAVSSTAQPRTFASVQTATHGNEAVKCKTVPARDCDTGPEAADDSPSARAHESDPSETAGTTNSNPVVPTSTPAAAVDDKGDGPSDGADCGGSETPPSASNSPITSATDPPPVQALTSRLPARPPAEQPSTEEPGAAPMTAEDAATGMGEGGPEAEAEDPPDEGEEEPPYKPLAPLLSAGEAGDVRYRIARIKSRNAEPLKTPPLDPAEEAELRRVWQTEWFGFPKWELVALARAARREPDAGSLAAMRAVSSSPRFVMLHHPARREFFLGAFATGHGLARVDELSSDRVWDSFTWDAYGTTSLGSTTTTADICAKIIIPATRAFGAAYVDLYLNDELWGVPQDWEAQAKPGVGHKNVRSYQPEPQAVHTDSAPDCRFLSHAWACPFMELVTVATVEGTPPRQVPGPYWIDIFCKNQHVPIKESDLTTAILGSKGVVLAMWPWPSPLLVTRVWCLFEILNAIKTKVKLELQLCDGARSGFRRALDGKYNGFTYRNVRADIQEKGLSYLLPGADELIQAIDVRGAQATVAADKDMILRLIERDMGSEDMNSLIREMLRGGLSGAAAEVVDSIVGQQRAGYMQYSGGYD